MAEPPAQPKPRLTFGQRSDVGMIRLHNQDSAFSIVFADDSHDTPADFGVFIVADGMGGHDDGERASRLITCLVSHQVMNLLHENMLRNNSSFDDNVLLDKLTDVVAQARKETDEKVRDGETTCTLALIVNNKLYIAHVGDSRVYLISEHQITLLTADVPLIRYLGHVDDSHLKRSETYDLGADLTYVPPVMTSVHSLAPASYVLLCTDGLWGLAKTTEILEIVQNAKTPQRACDSLINLVNVRGGNDNITAIVVQIP